MTHVEGSVDVVGIIEKEEDIEGDALPLTVFLHSWHKIFSKSLFKHDIYGQPLFRHLSGDPLHGNLLSR